MVELAMRILVVEDEKRIADFLSRGIESAGYAVDMAGTGSTALDLVHATEYDLIILDLGLPDMDGLQVLQKVRNRKTSPPVLILSARDAVDDRVKGLEVGADDYLVKPFSTEELLARVRALLRRVQRQVHAPAFELGLQVRVFSGGERDHVFRLDDAVSHVHHLVQTLQVRRSADQQRRQFVRLRPRQLDELRVTHYVHISTFLLSLIDYSVEHN